MGVGAHVALHLSIYMYNTVPDGITTYTEECLFCPPHLPTKGWGTYCFWDRSHWRRCKTSCQLCNLNTLWNILMILGRNVDQDEMTCRIQD